MIRLASVIETFEAPFLAQYGDSLLPSQRQALAAMKSCRSSASPVMQAMLYRTLIRKPWCNTSRILSFRIR